MSTVQGSITVDSLKCWICESPSDHLKKIDGTRCMKLYICSEKCRKVFIERLIYHGNVDPQKLKEAAPSTPKSKRLTTR